MPVAGQVAQAGSSSGIDDVVEVNNEEEIAEDEDSKNWKEPRGKWTGREQGATSEQKQKRASKSDKEKAV